MAKNKQNWWLSGIGLVMLFAACLSHAAFAADLQARTADGQVVQGEYLGTDNNIVRLKTAYGTVAIPSKDIVSLSAVATAPAGSPDGTPKTLPAGVLAPMLARKDEAPEESTFFKEPKGVNMLALLATRMPQIPEALKNNRIELVRLIRNYIDSTDSSRLRIIRTLQNYGLMAYPFVESAYTGSNDLNDKIELLQSLALPHKPFTAAIYVATHSDALAEMDRTSTAPPPLPPEILTLRTVTPNRAQLMRGAARHVRAVEGYAAISGGPFNALFLLGIYKFRYGGDSDPLLRDFLADRARLAATANDFKSKASGWTPEDRVMLIEMCFPLYFKNNDELQGIAGDMLKKLLPDAHPKWNATEALWFEWWQKHRDELLKSF